MPVEAKICGLTNAADATFAHRHGARWLGFVFHAASPRSVSLAEAGGLADALPDGAETVAVTVDADDGFLDRLVETFRPALLQLHGDETPERVAEIGRRYRLPTIKAVAVANMADIASAEPYEPVADRLLFDTKTGSTHGGTGITFDWSLMKDRPRGRPWFLAGGLDAANVAEGVRMTGARAVDASSRLESAPGKKNLDAVRNFLETMSRLP